MVKRGWAIALLLLVLSTSTSFNTRKLIAWSDFKGTPRYDSLYIAEISCNITYTYTLINNKVVITFYCDVAPSSWVKLEHATKLLLEHEQGHYDIWYLACLEFKVKAESIAISYSHADYILTRLLADSRAKYEKMHDQYDRETAHGTIISEQKRWNTILKEALK